MIPRIFSFINRYLFHHPIYLITYGLMFLRRDFYFTIRFLTTEEEQEAIRSGKTIIRLGEGDFVSIPLDLPTVAGRIDRRVKEMILSIIRRYDKRAPYILGVPKFLNVSNHELAKRGKEKVYWAFGMKVMYLLKFKKNIPYMDAHDFYYDNYFENNVAPLIVEKKIILLANKKTIGRQRENSQLPFRDIRFIETPSSDAIDAYERIKVDIDETIRGIDKQNIMLLSAMGPVGKYILLEYAYRGYQGIDIGKVAEIMFTGESIEYMV